MAARFWVGGSGTWSTTNTTNWSATSGGAGGASVPGASDDVTIDGNSGSPTITTNYNASVISVTINAGLQKLGKELGAEVECFQTNHEGAMCERICTSCNTMLCKII